MERGGAKQTPRAQRAPASWLEPAPPRDGPERDRPTKVLYITADLVGKVANGMYKKAVRSGQGH